MNTILEVQYYYCFACDKKISEYHLEEILGDVKRLCDKCFYLRKDYFITTKQLQEVSK